MNDILGEKKQKTIAKRVLQQRNFKFKYHTHNTQNKQGANHFVYTLAWREKDADNVVLYRN